MARPSLYTEDVNIEPLRALYGTPKHAYELLSLRGHVKWPEFYRMWSQGVGRPETVRLVSDAHREWCARERDPEAVDHSLPAKTLETLAWAHS